MDQIARPISLSRLESPEAFPRAIALGFEISQSLFEPRSIGRGLDPPGLPPRGSGLWCRVRFPQRASDPNAPTLPMTHPPVSAQVLYNSRHRRARPQRPSCQIPSPEAGAAHPYDPLSPSRISWSIRAMLGSSWPRCSSSTMSRVSPESANLRTSIMADGAAGFFTIGAAGQRLTRSPENPVKNITKGTLRRLIELRKHLRCSNWRARHSRGHQRAAHRCHVSAVAGASVPTPTTRNANCPRLAARNAC